MSHLPSFLGLAGACFTCLLTACVGQPDAAPPACRALTFDGAPYSVCSFDPQTTKFRLFHTAPDGVIYGQFDRLVSQTESQGETLTFAMNGGMYHDDRTPVGLYIENGKDITPIQIGAGPGNFGMVPNGVFVIAPGKSNDLPKTIAVMKSEDYAAATFPAGVTFATQSGPLLVLNGALHPKFNANGPSKKRRNGVGVSSDGRVHFAISEVPVNFHAFARLFRDALDAPNALFLDGQVSKLYSTELQRNDQGLDMGPIIAVVE